MKKISIMIIICMCSILLSACAESCNEACYHEDWAPYEHYTDEVNISIKSNIFSMKECYLELIEISKKYAKDMKLTHAEYYFNKEEDDYAVFTMHKEYIKKSGVEYGINCFIYVNTETNKVYKIGYENGITKRVTGGGPEFERQLEIDAKDSYNLAIENLSDEKYNRMKKVTVVYYFDSVSVRALDSDNIILYKEILYDKHED